MGVRVEAITTCFGYADFLAVTLAENLPLLDDIVVVTAKDDEETQSVCRKHSVRFVMTDEHLRDGEFNKSRAIRRGFDQIGAKDWVLHLDSDIVLPRKFKRLIETAHLKETTIYGADRCNLIGWDKWQSLKKYAGSWDNHAHECGHWFHPDLKVGSRWISSIHGYVPIGFMQLLAGSALIDKGYHVRNYPLTHGDAARTDVQFALQWDRRDREVLAEVVVLHLESEEGPLGVNWKGRKTKRFGPEPALSGWRPTQGVS